MKKIKVLVMVVLFIAFGIFKVNAEWIYQVPDCKKSSCGKIIGQIYDAQTKEKVKEKFLVLFLDCSELDEFSGDYKCHFMLETENNGHILGMLPEGSYFLLFRPSTYDTNYSFDPSPKLSPETAQKIVVKREQITKIKKLAKKGGKIKVTLVDINNNKIDPRTIYKNKFSIKVDLSSQRVSRHIFAESDSKDRNELNDGEMIIPCLPPALYDLFVTFEDIGYGIQTINNINVERNQTTDVNVLFDVNDKTGICGYVFFENKIPLPNIHVRVELSEKEIFFIGNAGSIRTNENGFFKIVSLKEGVYKLFIYGKFNGRELEKNFQNIIIKKDVLIRKDIVENISDQK